MQVFKKEFDLRRASQDLLIKLLLTFFEDNFVERNICGSIIKNKHALLSDEGIHKREHEIVVNQVGISRLLQC